MYYLKKGLRIGVELTNQGYPVCHLDNEDCQVEVCRYFFPESEIGNCVLRVDKKDHCTLDVLAKAWGVSRQRVDQMEKRAFRKLIKRHGSELRDILMELTSVSRDENPNAIRNQKVASMIRTGRFQR